jgi:pimeloyl-ACP methyl ester carboxylesterase/membrane protein DedA with SNARE-associated domain
VNAAPARRPRRFRWWHAYVPLLALSHVWQLVAPPGGPPSARDGRVEVAAQTAAGPAAGGSVTIAYRDVGAGPAVLYLHGSPGSANDAADLAAALSADFRVIAPDLPGFGESTAWIPDYSISAHARYVLALMDALRIPRAHLVAHSMGSGVAFHVARLAPDRVETIVSYAGIGVQEEEGSGDYHLEHLKYAVGYALVVAVPEAVPHFGLLGPRAWRHATIRNFWDTDQRPLRALLETLETPLLLVHGREDPLVPLRAAEEHHRIVEHSELVILDASHFLVFTRHGAARLAAEIAPFLQKHLDPGRAPERRTTDRSRGPGDPPQLPVALRLDRGMGPWAQLAALFAGTFVSEDLTTISAGLLARAGRIDYFVAVLGCLLGIFATDVGLWAIGRVVGRRALRWRFIARRVPEASVGRFGERFDRHLGQAVVASRFLPGTRIPMYVAAGIVSRRPVAFFGWLFVAAALWTPLLVAAAMVFGPLAARPFEMLVGAGWISWALAVLLIFLLVRAVAMAFSWRGRARLAAAISRLWRWEFWPVWLFYLPLLPWIAYLAARHGGLATPTAANPGLPHGGFVGESKIAILRELPAERIVPSVGVAPGRGDSRLAGLRAHAEGSGWSLPLVLKPDEGQRGVGLKLARSWDDVAAYLAGEPRAVLAQTYDPGPHEAGIFYYRLPGEEEGKIFSITDKRFPEITGDGSSTIEELILRDGRLRMQAGVFLRRWAGRLSDVPRAGERVRLAVAGNHCQGTMFLDGAHLATPELGRAVDRVARRFSGFHFGRFDVRYGSADQIRRGEGFRIVELNGVTSESTNVYDPSFGLLAAYGTLARQWSLAFRIGAANRRRGHRVSTLASLVRAAHAHYNGRNAAPAD